MSGRHQIDFIPRLRERTARAVADRGLHDAVAQATDKLAERREPALAELVEVDELRDAARSARARALANLPDLLGALADRMQARGVKVAWASTAAEAGAYVAEVARGVGARTIVKSKSMASEEIGLNSVLEATGARVVETDLGEWIIQVARETPSHIIIPAIHKRRGDVARALSQVAGGDLSDVPEELAAFARSRLRGEFLKADLGISGVNFAVAETGTLALVTNEGNGRMVTSLPKVHVAVMGMERVAATWADLELLMALLPRSATGQAITTYLSLISGPRGAGEADGPEDLHLVILDNGRSEVLGSEFAEILHCIRCGACLNVCPVYRQTGGHAYGWVYAGPIGAVLTPLLSTAATAGELGNASSLCGACWQACPVRIPLQDLLLAHRRAHSEHANPAVKAAWSAWSLAWSHPRLYEASLRAATSFRALAPLAGRLPGMRRWSSGRGVPPLPPKIFRRMWRDGEIP